MYATYRSCFTSNIFIVSRGPSNCSSASSNCFALFFIKRHFFSFFFSFYWRMRGHETKWARSRRTLRFPRDSFLSRFYSTHSRSIPDFASYPRVTSNWPDSCSLYPMSWVHLHHRRRAYNRFTHPVDDFAFGPLATSSHPAGILRRLLLRLVDPYQSNFKMEFRDCAARLCNGH